VAVTYMDVATSLGRTLNADEQAQAEQWIDDARLVIGARLGDLDELDQDLLDYVVREAVVARIKRPDEATQVQISVDDATTSRRYERSTGTISILDEWWALLSPITDSGIGFSTRPAFEADDPLLSSWE
jgi:hypothetical protein